MALNQCAFIGHVGKDPEVRELNSGDKVANFSLAVSEKWKDKNSGEMKEKTEWIRVVAFGALAKVIADWVKSGSKLYVSGKLQTRKWQNKDGVDQFTTEIVLQGYDSKLELLSPKDSQSGGQSSRSSSSQGAGGSSSSAYSQPKQGTQAKQGNLLDDEIPFMREDR